MPSSPETPKSSRSVARQVSNEPLASSKEVAARGMREDLLQALRPVLSQGSAKNIGKDQADKVLEALERVVGVDAVVRPVIGISLEQRLAAIDVHTQLWRIRNDARDASPRDFEEASLKLVQQLSNGQAVTVSLLDPSQIEKVSRSREERAKIAADLQRLLKGFADPKADLSEDDCHIGVKHLEAMAKGNLVKDGNQLFDLYRELATDAHETVSNFAFGYPAPTVYLVAGALRKALAINAALDYLCGE